MKKLDSGGWKVDDTLSSETAAIPEIAPIAKTAPATPPRRGIWSRRLWPFGKRPRTPAV